MLTKETVEALIGRITYRDWRFIIHAYDASFSLQIVFTDPDTGFPQSSRRWTLPWHACASEVVHTALLAVLTAEEHEARERFLLDGRAVFGPHHSIEALLAVADDVETREAQEAAP